jgi:3-hydroxybutyryl-CoA dehydratase
MIMTMGRAKASVTITKDDGVTVIEAEIGGIVPRLEERKVLCQMLLEGDPTNGSINTQQSPITACKA